MLQHIGPVITKLTKLNKPQEIADNLQITPALISTWKQKDNDFCPRVGVAALLYKHYGMVIYPYAEEALIYWLQENDT